MGEARVETVEVGELPEEFPAAFRARHQPQQPLPPVGDDERPDEALFDDGSILVGSCHRC